MPTFTVVPSQYALHDVHIHSDNINFHFSAIFVGVAEKIIDKPRRIGSRAVKP